MVKVSDVDAFTRDFGNVSPGQPSAPSPSQSVDAFTRDFGDLTPAASSPSTQNMDFSYSDVPVPQNFDQATYAPAGAGMIRGAQTVGESIGRGEMAAGSKLGFIDPQLVQDATALQNQQRATYENQYGNNKLAELGKGAGMLATSAPLVMAGGELAGAIPGVSALGDALGGNALTAAGSRAAIGYGQGAASNALMGEDPNSGGVTGAALNTVLPGASKLAGYIGNKITGGGVDPAIAALASKAADYGITIPTAQISSSPFIKNLDAVLPSIPFSGHGSELAKAGGQFTQAVSRTFGADSPSLTPDVMQAAEKNLSDKYNTIAQNIPSIQISDNVLNKLSSLSGDANEVLGADGSKISGQIDKIVNLADENGNLSGAQWQALMRSGTPLDRLSKSSDPNVSYYARGIKDALYDGLNESAPESLVNDLNQTNAQWKNYKTVQDLATKSGITGEINPAQLFNATQKTTKKFGSQGLDDLQNLSDIGKQFFQKVPDSGTAGRQAAYNLLGAGAGAGGVGGAVTALGAGNPLLAAQIAGTTAGTSVAARVASSVLNSNMYRNALLKPVSSAVDSGIGIPAGKIIGNGYIPAYLAGQNALVGQ